MSAARVAIGSALVARPGPATEMWIGRRQLSPAARLFARALGVRDVGIGAGALASLRAGGGLRPWLVAGIAADSVDLAATLAERDKLPDTAVPLVVATAGAGILMGAAALAGSES